LGFALRAAGLARGGAAGLGLLAESSAALAGGDASLERARTEVALGAALRRANRRSDARAHLRTGLDGAYSCGARPLAARAREELAATGARPRREPLSGAAALTPTELRIARLAADGRSNPEIAQDLFVTRKTVEFHLSNAYRKLAIESRAQLAAALGAHAMTAR
ncbi:MAG: transcriptional regulator, LuxR family, partial [Conexibacter sp.]|nr:transcriptional regulator, LuxR family [Conexibacter sp.]